MTAGHPSPPSVARLDPDARRVVVAALAVAGCALSAYLALFQLDVLDDVWEPVFGDGSRAILHSSFSRALPVPDALLGTVAYGLEAALDLAGPRDRARTHPRLVLAFGAIVAAMAVGGLGLVALQAFVYRDLCTLCLASAVLSWTIAALSAHEVLDAIRHGEGVDDEKAPAAEIGRADMERRPSMQQHRRVVVVTGASAGLGRAAAVAFGRRGDAVALLARGAGGLEAARREVEAAGGQALAVSTDVADADAVETAAARIEAELGPIDVWVNNAMTTVFAPFHEIAPDEYRRATEVTYLGFVYGTMSALRRMRPRDRGHIIQVGSALAYRGIPLQAPYCGAKHAIQGMVDSLRCELLHDGSNVRLTMVQMPGLNTPQFDWCLSRLPRRAQPVPPIYQPEVGAEAIVWAADHDRGEIYVGAPTTIAIVGNKIAPWIGDRYLARTGFQGQQSDEPERPQRPSNLWQPVPGDHGAHGRFDRRAHRRSRALWATLHRGTLAAAGTLVAAAVISAVRR